MSRYVTPQTGQSTVHSIELLSRRRLFRAHPATLNICPRIVLAADRRACDSPKHRQLPYVR